MIKKINNKKILFLIKVILPSLLFLIMLLSLFSLSNNETIINNLSKVFYEENEVELDNWEISTVFYDSTVDDGKTPLTDINWDASDGGCDTGETRTITIQINYKNSNAVQEYKPGDLKISFSNLLYSNTAQWSTTIILGANDGSHSGYDWTFEPYYNNANSYLAEASSAQKEYSFVNANTIEKYSNLEGTIQVTYILTPKKEENDTYWGNAMVERYKEECLHEFKKNISSFLKSNKETINSNELSFSYRRLYFHPWTHRYYSFTRIPYQLTSVDGLPSNYKDYYWVKYDANGTNSFDNSYSTHYPSVGVKLYIEEEFCEECIVLDEQGNEMSPDSNNKYRSNKEYIIVGYPKVNIM